MLMVQEAIEATSVLCVIGGSMGGMQALEWAIIGQEYVRSTIVIGCNSMHTAWQVRTPFTQSLTLSLSLPHISLDFIIFHTICVILTFPLYFFIFQIAISETQRQAIFSDPKWKGGYFDIK